MPVERFHLYTARWDHNLNPPPGFAPTAGAGRVTNTVPGLRVAVSTKFVFETFSAGMPVACRIARRRWIFERRELRFGCLALSHRSDPVQRSALFNLRTCAERSGMIALQRIAVRCGHNTRNAVCGNSPSAALHTTRLARDFVKEIGGTFVQRLHFPCGQHTDRNFPQSAHVLNYSIFRSIRNSICLLIDRSARLSGYCMSSSRHLSSPCSKVSNRSCFIFRE